MTDLNNTIDPNNTTDPGSVHQAALVIDTHADTPQRFIDEHWDFTSPLNGGMLNLETARAGNLAAEFFAIWVEPTQWKGRYAHRALSLIDGVLEQVRRHSGSLRLCTSPNDILEAHRGHVFAVLMGIEGGHSIENDLSLLRIYHRLGVRYMTLTWANSNEWADSSGDLNDVSMPHHNGLTPFGRNVIHEMNRLGMMIDVSHVSDKTFADVLDLTRAPIIASHSSARALTSAPRNMSDDMLRRTAANGGVVMVNFYSAFVDETYRTAHNAQKPERDAAHHSLAAVYGARSEPVPFAAANSIDRTFSARIPRPPLSSLVDHIDHVARIAGIEHVGIGTDFDGISATPEGIDSAADLPLITAALMARGFSASDMNALLGGNLMRVFRQVQAAAHP